MANRILTATLEYLRGCSQTARVPIIEMHLTRYFSIVELADTSVGACMSYYRLADNVLRATEDILTGQLSGKPAAAIDQAEIDELISPTVSNTGQRYLVATSLMASITSALSAPVIRAGGDEVFATVCRRPSPWVNNAESALVVGFGGYLEALATANTIKKLHIIDLFYEARRSFMETELDVYRCKFPKKVITASAGLPVTNRFRDYDLISITGSALCNGTLEGILAAARSDSILVLQGQSASLHPKKFFEEGISWVSTTLKPPGLGRIACGDYNGSSLRPYLDGGLPLVYLVRRNSSC